MPRTNALAAALAVATLAGAASAEIIRYDFPLNVEQEVPAPDVGDFTPSGTGSVTFDTDTRMLTWVINYQGLTGDIVAPGAHFHGPADFGETAGVQVTLTDGNPPLPPTGTLEGMMEITEEQAVQLRRGLWYANLHTERNPAGEIRGQVIPVPTSAGVLALGGVLVARRRRG